MLRTAINAGVTALLVGAGSAAASTTFYDGTFSPSDWSLTALTNANGTGSLIQPLQLPTGGNTGDYYRIRHNLVVSGPNGAVIGFHMNTSAFYTPSVQGAITSINYSEDSINFTPDTIVPGNGQGTGLAILQGGKYYRQQNPILVMPYSGYSSWTFNSAPGLVASDFEEVTLAGVLLSGSNPDFSAGGATMQLGFWRGNSGNGSYNTDCGIDNWHVEIVPAPASAGVLGLGLMLASRRRRGTRA